MMYKIIVLPIKIHYHFLEKWREPVSRPKNTAMVFH